MAATSTFCPQCHGAGEVHISLYERATIPVSEHKDEDKYRKNQLNSDFTCSDRSKAVRCRVCYGKGTL